MFEFSEISEHPDKYNDNNKISNNFSMNFANDSIYSENDNDISFLLISKKKLFEIEINFNEKIESNYLIKQNRNNKNIDNNRQIKFILKKENHKNLENNKKYIMYRKDAYYKHFKAIFAKFIKNKANKLKHDCFPLYDKNNFSAVSYKYTGNPKEKDNFMFLSFKIKELLVYGKNEKLKNRQYNNELAINFIENNESKARDKIIYEELINFLNDTVENVLINFYKNKEELRSINKDSKCQLYDQYFKKETGISLLENNGFIELLKKNFE
jgi:hypothetical protein